MRAEKVDERKKKERTRDGDEATVYCIRSLACLPPCFFTGGPCSIWGKLRLVHYVLSPCWAVSVPHFIPSTAVTRALLALNVLPSGSGSTCCKMVKTARHAVRPGAKFSLILFMLAGSLIATKYP